MNNQFNPNKPYQCRDGCKAKIVDTGLNGVKDIGYIRYNENGIDTLHEVHIDGRLFFTSKDSRDLINIPEKKMLDIWVNVYPGKTYAGFCYHLKESADSKAAPDRTACLHIQREYVEGEGL